MTPMPEDTPIRLPDPIHRPDLQSRKQRHLYAAVSTLGWLVWLYLFAPLLSLMAWLFGVNRFNIYVRGRDHHELHALMLYAIVIGLAGLAFMLWALYNLFRFRGRVRRARAESATLAEEARVHGVSEDAAMRMRHARVQRVHYDDEGSFIEVEVLDKAA